MIMNPGAGTRMLALVRQEIYIMRHSLETIIDLYFFSVMAILAFGLLSIFLTNHSGSLGGSYLLLGLVMWEVVRVNQYSMSVSSLWSVWSHNLSNLFVAPLSLTEYVASLIIASVIKAVTCIVVVGLMVGWLFHLNLLSLGFGNLVIYFFELAVFAWSLGLALLGLIFCFGTRIQSLAWGVVFAFQPLCATFFPLSILPKPLQTVANVFPPTHVFEAARTNLTDPSVQWSQLAWATGLNILFFVAFTGLFVWLVRHSQNTGQFAKNDQ